MKIIDIKKNDKYLTEYVKLCNDEWGSYKEKDELERYIMEKKEKILNEDKVIKCIGLLDDDILIGFISLFKYDGDERKDLSPWYATIYVKKEYRNNGYSKILNNAILKEASVLGCKKVYLKTNLKGYYEKFGAKYLDKLSNGEKLYYIDVK